LGVALVAPTVGIGASVWFDVGPVMCVWQFAPELKMQPWYAVRLVAASPVHVGDASACGAAAKPAKTTATKASDAHLVIFIPMFALHPV
jgi:hypothetical protein